MPLDLDVFPRDNSAGKKAGVDPRKVEKRLTAQKYRVGETCTIIAMAVWGWARMIPFILGDDAWAKHPNVKRLADEVSARPAVAQAVALKDKFTFKAEMDAEARRNMFKHLAA